MQYPLSTGEVARALNSTEPQLAELVRRGKIDPAPPVVAGRRLWAREHLLRAAEALGIPTDYLKRALEAPNPRQLLFDFMDEEDL